MEKEKDVLNECGHRNSERVEALKELPSSLIVCPACLLERIKEIEAGVLQVVADSNQAQIVAAQRIDELEAERDNWRRVCKKLETEKRALKGGE